MWSVSVPVVCQAVSPVRISMSCGILNFVNLILSHLVQLRCLVGCGTCHAALTVREWCVGVFSQKVFGSCLASVEENGFECQTVACSATWSTAQGAWSHALLENLRGQLRECVQDGMGCAEFLLDLAEDVLVLFCVCAGGTKRIGAKGSFEYCSELSGGSMRGKNGHEEYLLDPPEGVPGLVSADVDCAGTCTVSGCDRHFIPLSIWIAVLRSLSDVLLSAAAPCQGEARIDEHR